MRQGGGQMGKRAGRRLTREIKIGNPLVVVKGEIRKGIEAGEPLKHIADRIRMKCPMGKDRAIRMVMAEFDVVAKDWMNLAAD